MNKGTLFKNKYKDYWEISVKREQKVRNMFEAMGHKLKPFGFEAESTRYNSNTRHERGVPDYKVVGEEKYIEVTGTIRNVPEYEPIWVRPDKVQWALNRPDKKVILVHVTDKLNLVRYCHMRKIDQFPVETKLKNERFHIVPASFMKTLVLTYYG